MNHLLNIQQKIQSLSAAKKTVDQWKLSGEKVVFTNGCFDILHQGHVTYLAQSAAVGTKLVVGINSDASVKRLGKGDERPVNPESARSLVMAAMGFVDLVVVFDEATPLEMIVALEPSVLVKGADYDAVESDETNKRYIVGRKEVMAVGGTVQTIDLVPGFSTTNIIQQLKK